MRTPRAIAAKWLHRSGWVMAFALGALSIAFLAQAEAQSPAGGRGILAPGDAAVAGFSGARIPITIPKGADPAERTFIDVNGPSLRIVDLSDMGGPLDARLVPAPKPMTFRAADIGQVFAVALDDASPPNIYAAATSSYGLPIVIEGPDGALRHVKVGQEGVRFMPGLWGRASAEGGPGSIWKIDGVTGKVSLFANVGLDGKPNAGAALGGLAYDPGTRTFFVADRETGLVHAFSTAGAELWRFDHGVTGRPASGLPAVPYDPKQRLDVTNDAFDSTKPATWGLADPARRVFGLGVHAGRLYYAVAEGLQVWSIAIDANPANRNPRLEVVVPPAAAATEISKFLFDGEGRMILAERAATGGAFDFNLLTAPNVGRALRFTLIKSPDGLARTWQPVPNEYPIGFPGDYENANGGAAIGYDYDRTGVRDRSRCSGFLWSTGEDLRRSPDEAVAKRLDKGGPPGINGLQGNHLRSVRPDNMPPWETHFIDYDDRIEDEVLAGHMGDLAIWQRCGPDLGGSWQLPGWAAWEWWSDGGKLPPPPDQSCPSGQKKPGVTCCPKGTSPDQSGACKPWCPNGAMDLDSQKMCAFGFDNASFDAADPGALKCIGGSKPKTGLGIKSCIEKSPFFNPPQCAAGFVKTAVGDNIEICTPTPEQSACPFGQQINPFTKSCEVLCSGGIAWPGEQCCAAGAKLDAAGHCCPKGSAVNADTGQCNETVTVPGCPKSVVKKDAANTVCPPDSTCPNGATPDPKTGACQTEITFCPGGAKPDPVTGNCSAPPSSTCQPGDKGEACEPAQGCPPFAKVIGGACCTTADLLPGGKCAATLCGPDKTLLSPAGVCCSADKIYKDASGADACCTSSSVKDGKCGDKPLTGTPAFPGCSPGEADECCEEGYAAAKDGQCCLAGQLTSSGKCCAQGQSPNAKGECSLTVTGGTDGTPSGSTPPGSSVCCADGAIPVASGGCCGLDQVTTTGQCCPTGEKPAPGDPATCTTATPGQPDGPPDLVKPLCAPAYIAMADGSCCHHSKVSGDGKVCKDDEPDIPIKNKLKPGRDVPPSDSDSSSSPRRAPKDEPPAKTLRKSDPVEPPKRGKTETPKNSRANSNSGTQQDLKKAQDLLKKIVPKLQNGTKPNGTTTAPKAAPRTTTTPQNFKP